MRELRRWGAVAVWLGVVTTAAGQFLGADSCSTSGCHGGAADQSRQRAIWDKFDPHSRAHATLTMGRSARMMEVLGGTDATRDRRCTDCHAPHPTQRLEGVSCENCHGAGESWLRSHTRPDYTHADRLAAGMRDLRDPYARANACVACHQYLPLDLLQAGHPELIFELDGQLTGMKKHWRSDLDRPAAQTWLVGQAVALRELAGQPHERNRDQRDALVWLLTRAGADPSQPDALARRVAAESWTAERTRELLQRLASSSADFERADVSRLQHAHRAERLVLALDRLLAGQKSAELDTLFALAQSRSDFDPGKFAGALAQFNTSVSR